MEFGLPRTSYLSYVQKVVPSEPVVHIDNSDVISRIAIILRRWESSENW